MDHLVTWAGLGERRAARIVATLKDAGYLSVSQIRERLKDGFYRSFSAIKIVSTTLFDALGLRGWFNKERSKAKERLRKKQKAYEKACAKRGATMMKRLTAKIAGMAPTSPARHADEQARQRAFKNRQTPVPFTDATTGALARPGFAHVQGPFSSDSLEGAADGLIGISPGVPPGWPPLATLPQSLSDALSGSQRRDGPTRLRIKYGFIASVALAGRSAPPGPASWQDQRQSLPANPVRPEPLEGVPSYSQGKIPTTYYGTFETLRAPSPRHVPARDRGFGGVLRRVNQSTPYKAIGIA